MAATAALRPRPVAPISLPNRFGPQPEVDAEVATHLGRDFAQRASKDLASLVEEANDDVLYVADLIRLNHPRSATILENAVHRRRDALAAILAGA